MKNLHSLRFSFLLLAALSLLPFLSARAAEPAGLIVVATGEVVAVPAQGEIRPLRRRSPVYVGDLLRTGDNGQAQLRFTDGTILSLREGTELRIDAFKFDNHGGPGDSAFYTLLKGGFRTITGAIGKADPSAYRVNTPVATIGIRGTFYEAVLGDGLSVAVWQGRIVVANDQGSIELGEGQEYNFAVVPSAKQAPQGQLQPPPSVQASTTAAPGQPEGAGASTGATAGTGGSASGGGETSGGVEAFADKGGAASTGSNTPAGAPTDTGVSPSDTTSQTAAGTSAPIEPALPGSSTGGSVADARLSSAEQGSLATHQAGNYFAISVIGSDSNFGATADPTRIYVGSYGVDDVGGSVLYHTGYTPSHYSAGAAGNPDVIIRRNDAIPTALGTQTTFPVGDLNNLGVDWGVWDAGPVANCAPCNINAQNDQANAGQVVAVDAPMFWVTGQAATAATVATMSGTFNYSTMMMYNGGGTTGQVTGMSMTANVTFGAVPAVSGSMIVHVGSGTEMWNAGFSSGNVNGSTVDFQINTASRSLWNVATGTWVNTGDNVVGSAGGILIANPNVAATATSDPAVGALVGAFQFDADAGGTPTAHVEGIYVVSQ